MDSNNLSETYLKRGLYLALTPLILLSASVWFTSDSVAIILASTFHIYLYAILFALIIEFFPIRSTGGFFSTTNASYIFLLMGMFLGLKNFKNIFLK